MRRTAARLVLTASFTGVVLTLAAPSAGAASDNAACPGQNLPAETQQYRPIGLNVAAPLATSSPGAVADFVGLLAHSHSDC